MDLKTELDSIFAECSAPNWDGYDGEPISLKTLKNAYMLMESLPDWAIIPNVMPEPDGCIAFEWEDGRGNWIIVSVGPKEILYCTQGYHWEYQLPDGIPPEIYTRLDKHFRPGNLGGPPNPSL